LSSWRLELHEDLPSSQDHLIARARSGEPAGLAILALRQTAGRGQFGRVWQAPEGNLNLSLLLRPGTATRETPQWSLAVGVAAVEALQELVPEVRLKYPNDLMLNQRKLGGILVESEAGEGTIAWLVICIGINIAAAPDLPDQPTIALAVRGVTISPEQLAWRLLARIAVWRTIIADQGFAPVRAAWRARAVDPEAAEAHLAPWETD
jgi:BirA family biotin operon repressor/biotin-[acetyl-CoA-carboxylase] ligase